ncbi:MAG: allantoicase [Kordiimonadales bacterium]|nr:MAG: allantoicase [Kordiimonadales bacterium]
MSTPDFTRRFINLASPRLGAVVTAATDDFFADKARLIDPADPVFIVGKYDDNGKWMDGWESRRKRTTGHDHCIIKLGQPGIIEGFNIDTSHFTGNFPPAASIDVCSSDADVPGSDADWQELVAPTDLNGDSHHYIEARSEKPCTHLRLNILPDGGIARLRVYGSFYKNWQPADYENEIDLVAAENGGRPIVANNEHFGILANIMAPGRGINMGDGWETRRRREPGNDWAIVALGHKGSVEGVVVDTAHFKGNFPSAISLQAACVETGTDTSLPVQSQFWQEILPKQPLTADAIHEFREAVDVIGPVTHVRVNIYPDGGISRLRLLGKLSAE